MVEKTNLHMTYPGAPLLPHGEAFAPTEQPSFVTVTRRALLGGVAAACLGLDFDRRITDYKWPQSSTTLQAYSTGGAPNGLATFVIPGLGIQSGEGIMRALLPALRAGEFAGFIRYPDKSLDVSSISELINRTYHKLGLNGIVLYLHSMAGAMAPEIVEGLDSSVTVRRIDYNCSPWTAGFVYDEVLANIISRLPVEGSYGQKMAAQLFDRFLNPGYKDASTKEKLEGVWRMTNDKGSPKTWLDQINYLVDRRMKSYDSLPEHVPSTFITPADLPSDGVVKLAEAINTYTGRIPGEKRIVTVGCRGHANPRQHPREYNKALIQIYDSSDPSFNRSHGSLHPTHHNV